MGGLTGYFSFSSRWDRIRRSIPLLPTPFNLPADPNANILLDWQIDAPSGAYWGFDTGSTPLLTTNVNGQITSWNLFGVGGYCFDIIILRGCRSAKQLNRRRPSLSLTLISTTTTFRTSTPGTWTPGLRPDALVRRHAVGETPGVAGYHPPPLPSCGRGVLTADLP